MPRRGICRINRQIASRAHFASRLGRERRNSVTSMCRNRHQKHASVTAILTTKNRDLGFAQISYGRKCSFAAEFRFFVLYSIRTTSGQQFSPQNSDLKPTVQQTARQSKAVECAHL